MEDAYESALSNGVATSHMWLLNTWNITRKSEKINVQFYLF